MAAVGVSAAAPATPPLHVGQPRSLPAKRPHLAHRPVTALVRHRRHAVPGHSETSRRATPYGKSPWQLTRDYTPLVMAAVLAALGALLLIGGALSSSFVPLIGILLIILGGVVYFHWRYE